MVMGKGAEPSNRVHGQFGKAFMRLLRCSTVFLFNQDHRWRSLEMYAKRDVTERRDAMEGFADRS